MTQFRNPYHFVPLGRETPPGRVPVSEFRRSDKREHAHITHDRWVAGTFSGRVTCTIETETPLIVANQQVARSHWTKLLKPFELTEGTPALPASALRGMISSISEAASHSALRVLKGDTLSFRRTMKDEKKLSALGLVVAGPDGTLHLRPLAMPTFIAGHDAYHPPEHFPIDIFPAPAFKVYLNPASSSYLSPNGSCTFKDGNGHSLRNATMSGTSLSPFYGMRLEAIPGAWQGNHVIPRRQQWQRHPTDRSSPAVPDERYVIGRKPAESRVLPWSPALAEQGYTRGIFRGLGMWTEERKDARPPTKKHEFFIPLSENMESWPSIPISSTALERFNELADQRTEVDKLLPYEPIATRPGRQGHVLRLTPGDVVYFDARKLNGVAVVTEISFSSIWRGRAESVDSGKIRGNNTTAFFAAHSPDLVPLHPGRSEITLAEQLFGAVEVRQQVPLDRENAAFALAGRLRFSHGKLTSAPGALGCYQPQGELLTEAQRARIGQSVADIPLKNLASPKLPCPALYFRPKNGHQRHVAKADLSTSTAAPLGRKFYLRRKDPSAVKGLNVFVHPDLLTNSKDLASIQRQHQSVKNFVRPGCKFEFHVDFDNLSELELGLLLYSLHPCSSFRHQLGHGKPLGLGQIKVEPSKVELVDRRKRYAQDSIDATRFHEVHQAQWVTVQVTKFHTWAMENNLNDVLTALELLGSPPGDDIPTHYPQASTRRVRQGGQYQDVVVRDDSRDFEQEHFHWFVQNDAAGVSPQHLGNLVGAQELPTLHRDALPAPHNPAQQAPRPEQQATRPVRQQGIASLGGQTIEAKVCKTDPFELGIHWQGRDFKINLSGASKAAIQSRNPSLGATIKVRIKGGPRPDNIQADIID